MYFSKLFALNKIRIIFKYNLLYVSTKLNYKYINIAKNFEKSLPKHLESSRPTLWSWNIISGILVWFGLINDYEKTTHPLILTIKRGILCMQRKHYKSAEIILHLALKMANDLCYDDAETYVYDILANNAFLKQDMKTAEKLFIEVMRRLVTTGMDVNSEAMIEISIKLSHIYSLNAEFDKCNKGFQFCLTQQNKRVENIIDTSIDDLSDDQINSLALYGMCLDYYAKHLSSVGKFKDAVNSYESAIKICEKINGSDHSQTLVLLNDLADTFAHLSDYDKALVYMKKAVDGAAKIDSEDLGVFYYNLGSIYLRQFNYKFAQKYCFLSLQHSLNLNYKTLESKAQECIDGAKQQ